MNELTEESFAEFDRRFGGLHDACIRDIAVSYGEGGGEGRSRDISIQIDLLGVHLLVVAASEGYPNDVEDLRLRFDKVLKFRLFGDVANEGDWDALAGGLLWAASFQWARGVLWVDFDRPEDFDPRPIQDMDESRFFVACKEAWWEVLPSSEPEM